MLNFLMWTIKLLLHYAVIYLLSSMFTTVFIAHPEHSDMWSLAPRLLLTIIVLLGSAPLIVGKLILIVPSGSLLCPLSLSS